MMKAMAAALLGVWVLAQQPQGSVTQSELNAPGVSTPREVPAAPAKPSPAETPQEATQNTKALAPPPAAPAATSPAEREPIQSSKPVAAFWIVIPGR